MRLAIRAEVATSHAWLHPEPQVTCPCTTIASQSQSVCLSVVSPVSSAGCTLHLSSHVCTTSMISPFVSIQSPSRCQNSRHLHYVYNMDSLLFAKWYQDFEEGSLCTVKRPVYFDLLHIKERGRKRLESFLKVTLASQQRLLFSLHLLWILDPLYSAIQVKGVNHYSSLSQSLAVSPSSLNYELARLTNMVATGKPAVSNVIEVLDLSTQHTTPTGLNFASSTSRVSTSSVPKHSLLNVDIHFSRMKWNL